MKIKLYILILIIMFFFKNSLSADNENLFYDFKINDVSGNELNLKILKIKVFY